MQQMFNKFFLVCVAMFAGTLWLQAQTKTDTVPVAVNAELVNIFNQKNPKKYKIASIKVTGNNYFDEALLISVSNLSVGDEVQIPGGDNFAKAITKLWGQNYFSDVEIFITNLVDKNIDIEIHVTERPRLSKFYFKGTKKGESEDLTGKSGLVTGRVITSNMKINAIEAIKKYYSEKGYRNVKAKIEEVKDPTFDNSQILNIYVTKGNKVKISQINFVDVTVDQAKLKKEMKGTKEMSRLTLFPASDKGGFAPPKRYTFKQYLADQGLLSLSKTKRVLDPYVRIKFSSAKFSEKKYEEDKEKLLDFYNANGYRDAGINKDTFYFNSKGNMNIDIAMSEGKQYYFGNISWRGNTKYSDTLLSNILGIKKGDIYNLDILNKKLGKNLSPEGGDISGLYMDDGYLFFRTEPVETAVYNDTIDFEIRLIEGPQATIKNVRIAGNDKTKEYVIRRELRTIPGEKFSRTDLIRSQREIANLGYFNQEKIGMTPVPNQEDGTVDINYSVEEKSNDQLELSAGFGGGIGLTGTLGVSFNNFSIKNIFKKDAWQPLPQGDGQKLSLRIQSNGRAFRSYNASFTEPWLGGKKRNALSFSIYDTKFSNAWDPITRTFNQQNARNSFFQTTGASVGITKQLQWPDNYFSLGLTAGFVRYRLKNYPIDQVNLPGFTNGFSHNLNFKVTLLRSSIDAPIFPRSGSTFNLSLQVTPPWSQISNNFATAENPYRWIEYHKWRYTGQWFVPIGKPHGEDRNKQFVLMAAVKAGFLGRYNRNQRISPFERFQVGNAGLANQFQLLGNEIIAHRGYPVYESSDPRVNPEQQGASQYFTIFNKYTLEMRYPLSLSPTSTIYGLGFFEAANGWYDMKSYNPFQLRRSVGVGMRFFLPMFGLLGFDYGIGLDRFGPNTRFRDGASFTFMLGFEPE